MGLAAENACAMLFDTSCCGMGMYSMRTLATFFLCVRLFVCFSNRDPTDVFWFLKSRHGSATEAGSRTELMFACQVEG